MLYPIAVEKGDELHAYSVIVPDIAGCFSAGDTLEETIENVKQAIAGHLEILAEDGEDIPLASGFDKFINEKEYEGYIWAIVDVSRYLLNMTGTS